MVKPAPSFCNEAVSRLVDMMHTNEASEGHDLPQSMVGPAETFTPLLSTEDVCALFRRSERSIRRWVKQGRLPAIRVGGAMFFDPADIRALNESRLKR